VPDEVNPARLFQDDEAPPPGAEEEFPNLAEVPDEPRPASTPEEIREVREGLIADRENARYTDAELRNRSIDEVDFATAPPSAGQARRPVSGGGDSTAAVAEAEEIARAAAERAKSVSTEVEPEAGTASQVVASPAPAVEAKPLDEPPPAAAAEATAGQPGQARAATSLDTFKEQFSDAFNAEGGSAQTAAAVPTGTIWFAPESKALGQEQRDALEEIAAAHAEQGGTLRVVGHAPAAADAHALAYDRALAAAAALEQFGVPVDRMQVFAGPADPSSDGAAPDRVDIFVEQ
jgi:outer membrane protein OmpA-like peptidoglycan-associated protein